MPLHPDFSSSCNLPILNELKQEGELWPVGEGLTVICDDAGFTTGETGVLDVVG